MTIDPKQRLGSFVRLHVAAYRKECGGQAKVSDAMIDEAIERAVAAWNASRKPRKATKEAPTEAAAIYALFPRKIGRQAALRAISKALDKASAGTLEERVRLYASYYRRWPEKEQHYSPHPATWFNDERWLDDEKEWHRPGMAPKAPPPKPAPAAIPEPAGWRELVLAEWSDASWLYAEAKGGQWSHVDLETQQALASRLSQ